MFPALILHCSVPESRSQYDPGTQQSSNFLHYTNAEGWTWTTYLVLGVFPPFTSQKPRHIPILSFPACISLYAPMLRLGHLLLYLDQLVSQATKPGRRNTKPPVKQKKEQNKYIWHGKIHETSLLFSLLSCRFLYKQRHPLIWQNYIISPT